ncbi:hypothetical protein C4568_00330 [Candidatus Parcubacteria bacterium]|nr:MAG: hypothetical protein C4568_00330 [Candidatus Parcubacteria bacterium]
MTALEGGPDDNFDAQREDLRNRVANLDLDDFVRQELTHQINRSRNARDFARINETISPFESGNRSSAGTAETVETSGQAEARETQTGKMKFRVAMTDEDFEVYDSNNNRHTFASPEEQQEILEAVTVAMGGGSSDKYDIDILPTIDGRPVFPSPENATTEGRAGAEQGPERGRDRRRREGGDGDAGDGVENAEEEKPLEPEALKQAQRDLRTTLEHSRRLTDIQKEEFEDQITLMLTKTEARNILESIVEKRKAGREEQTRPPEPMPETPPPPSAEPTASHPPLEGPPPPPPWAGQYNGATPWRNFNAADYARMTPMSMQEILANPRYNELFGEFVTALAPNESDLTDLVLKVGRGEKDPVTGRPLVMPDDALQMFNYAQSEFTLQMQRMEKIKQEFKPEDLRMMIARTPALKSIMELNKAEPTTEAFIDAMFHTAVHNKGSFENFNRAFTAYKDLKETGRAKKSEQEIGELCKRLEIPRENYESIIDPNDRAGTEQRLTQVIRGGKRGLWQKAMDGAEELMGLKRLALPGSSHDRAITEKLRAMKFAPTERSLLDTRSWVTSKIAETQQQMLQGIAVTLQSDEFNQAMVRRAFAVQEIAPVPSEKVPQTFEQVRAEAAMIDRDYAERLFDRDLEAYAISQGRTAEDFSNDERLNFRDNVWYPPEARGTAKGRGMLSLLARALQRMFLRLVGSQVRVNRNERKP